MKKFFLIALAMVGCLAANAQNDSREPGLYNVDGDNSTALTFCLGMGSTSNTKIMGLVDVGKSKKSFKGVTSDTPCKKAEFVLVIDPEKKAAVQTLKKYDPFIKTMTPELMILVPLEVDKKKRIYDEGKTINGFNVSGNKQSIEFEYEQISDNSWKITTELPAGEYAWAFKIAKFGGYELDKVFDFTIVE